ncbi:hypothetical protein BH10ACT7_BH10ACT7_29980 [soil metagenome]
MRRPLTRAWVAAYLTNQRIHYDLDTIETALNSPESRVELSPPQ